MSAKPESTLKMRKIVGEEEIEAASTSAVQHTVAQASTSVASTSTVCMPTSNEEEELDVARTLSLLNECNSKEVANKENVPLDELATIEEKVAAAGLLETADIQFSFTCDRSTQVNGDIVTPFISLINTDEKLSSMTGLENLELLDTIVELCEMCEIDKQVHKLLLKERIILTFMKMKTRLPYAIISIMFNIVNSNTCITIFDDTVMLIHNVLKNAITWVSSEAIFHNMPYSFSDFQKVRVVIDCIEIPITKPKCLCCRVKSYSHVKGTNTIKFMTGASPGGLITFISKGYGGRASDKAIFEQSGLVTKLNVSVDYIMLDKGFRIEEVTRKHGIKVIQPPFLIKEKQFSEEEALLNAKIAKAREHIERSNQRIKAFKIFNTAFPVSLLPIADELFVIACAVINLSAPILSDDKFMK